MTWRFDAPTGTFRNPPVEAYLWALAADDGPCCRLGLVEIDSDTRIEQLGLVDVLRPEHEVLIRQARLLRCVGLDSASLRIALPSNFGRDKAVAWYHLWMEKLYDEGAALPIVKVRDVLSLRTIQRMTEDYE